MKYVLLFIFSFNLLAVTSVIPDKDNSGNLANSSNAFANKSTFNFRGTGYECIVAASTSTTCIFTVTYAHVKFNGISILGADLGDKADLKIKDTATGTYSTVPNSTLNQFGFSWYLVPVNCKELLPYPSDLYIGMIIEVTYTNILPASKSVYINHYIHEE